MTFTHDPNQLNKDHEDTPTTNHTQPNNSASNTNTTTSYDGSCGRVVSKLDKVIAKWEGLAQS